MTNEELVKRYQDGDLMAMEDLITQNIGLVKKIASKYRQSYSFEDACQDGCTGLMEAAKRYDHRPGTKFSSYAYMWIQQHIQVGQPNGHDWVRRATQKYRAQHPDMTFEEFYQYLRKIGKGEYKSFSRKRLAFLLEERSEFSMTASLKDEGDINFIENLPDHRRHQEQVDDADEAHAWILTYPWLSFVYQGFQNGRTMREIAKENHIKYSSLWTRFKDMRKKM